MVGWGALRKEEGGCATWTRRESAWTSVSALSKLTRSVAQRISYHFQWYSLIALFNAHIFRFRFGITHLIFTFFILFYVSIRFNEISRFTTFLISTFMENSKKSFSRNVFICLFNRIKTKEQLSNWAMYKIYEVGRTIHKLHMFLFFQKNS